MKPQNSKNFGSRKSKDFLGIEDLAELLGKTRSEVEEMLRQNDVIELNLNERQRRHKEDDELRIYE